MKGTAAPRLRPDVAPGPNALPTARLTKKQARILLAIFGGFLALVTAALFLG